jgi:mycothione reductase
VVVGAGSGNMLPPDGLDDLSIAIVESDRFGGTCVNRGCIPSKMLVYTADVAEAVRHAGRYGVEAQPPSADWPAIRERVFARLDPMHERAVAYRRRTGVDVYLGQARFTGPRTLEVNGEELRGENVVVAAGSRPRVPPIPGLEDAEYDTSDTIMRVDPFPESMVVLGGGFVTAEMSHVFGSLGSAITIVHRGSTLLAHHDEDIQRSFTDRYRERFALRLDTHVTRVETTTRGIAVHVDGPDGAAVVEADRVLVALGRVPNSDELDVAAGGIEMDDDGNITTDDSFATNVPGVWAIGDLANHFQLKHVANAEIQFVMHNILHPEEPSRAPIPLVPAAVFADPQVASVGPTEHALRADGRRYVVGRRDYGDTGYGWAMEDTTSFVKVIADPDTRLLLAAHAIGPHASMLLQPLIQAISLGNTVDQLADDVLYIHPALTEVVAQALLELPPPE